MNMTVGNRATGEGRDVGALGFKEGHQLKTKKQCTAYDLNWSLSVFSNFSRTHPLSFYSGHIGSVTPPPPSPFSSSSPSCSSLLLLHLLPLLPFLLLVLVNWTALTASVVGRFLLLLLERNLAFGTAFSFVSIFFYLQFDFDGFLHPFSVQNSYFSDFLNGIFSKSPIRY